MHCYIVSCRGIRRLLGTMLPYSVIRCQCCVLAGLNAQGKIPWAPLQAKVATLLAQEAEPEPEKEQQCRQQYRENGGEKLLRSSGPLAAREQGDPSVLESWHTLC